MITTQERQAAEQEAEAAYWREVEATAQAFSRAVNLPPLRITVEDRLKGAIVTAVTEIELGHTSRAVATLKGALKL